MKCDKCDEKATVFLTQFIDGNMKKVCLCENCAAEQGVTDPMGFSLVDMVMDDSTKGEDAVMSLDLSAACPACSFKLDDLRKVGRLGCSECYKTFSSQIQLMLTNMHHDVKHTGKVPEGLVEVQLRAEHLSQLKDQLNRAISEEDYEAAASLRDEITEMSQTKELK